VGVLRTITGVRRTDAVRDAKPVRIVCLIFASRGDSVYLFSSIAFCQGAPEGRGDQGLDVIR